MMVQESVESGGPGQDQATQTDDEDIGTDSPRPPRHAPARPARPTSFNCAGQIERSGDRYSWKCQGYAMLYLCM